VIKASPKTEFTSPELLFVADRNGLHASSRLITDWVSLGLVDQPTRRGLGRGKGSVAVWPRTQAQLFIDLLTLRQRHGVARVAPLANLPVLGWLYSYPDVPLRQVRRALSTWCGRHRQGTGVSRDVARRTARELTKTLEHPHASVANRAALRRILEDSVRAQVLDREGLREALLPVFDPHDERRTTGPYEARTGVDQVIRLFEARFAAVKALDNLTAQEYEDARLIYVASRAEYAEKQPSFAADPQTGPLFKEPTFAGLLWRACRDVLTILGMGRLAPGRSTELAAEARRRIR
jgi:hypothetical protein